MSKENEHLFFGIQKITLKNTLLEFSEKVDIHVKIDANKITFQSLFQKSFYINYKGEKTISINGKPFKEKILIKPLDIFSINSYL